MIWSRRDRAGSFFFHSILLIFRFFQTFTSSGEAALPFRDHRSAFFGQAFMHSPQRMHSALSGSFTGSTFILQIFAQAPQ